MKNVLLKLEKVLAITDKDVYISIIIDRDLINNIYIVDANFNKKNIICFNGSPSLYHDEAEIIINTDSLTGATYDNQSNEFVLSKQKIEYLIKIY